MFDNIGSLRFAKQISNISNNSQQIEVTAMISSEGEVMEFRTPQLVSKNVEDWMTLVEEEMKRTNYLITKESIFYYRANKSRYDYLC